MIYIFNIKGNMGSEILSLCYVSVIQNVGNFITEISVNFLNERNAEHRQDFNYEWPVVWSFYHLSEILVRDLKNFPRNFNFFRFGISIFSSREKFVHKTTRMRDQNSCS